MKNLRIEIACKVISMAIKIMPRDWRSDKAICNLIKSGDIEL
jgi:hypothetical protein